MGFEPMLTTEQINDLHRLYWSEHWPIRKIDGRDRIAQFIDEARHSLFLAERALPGRHY